MRVRDLMVRGVVTASTDEDLRTAVERMREHGCGALPVIDRGGKVLGIVTDRDVCMALLRSGGTLAQARVSSAMSAPAHRCSPSDDVLEAERALGLHQVRRLPVVDEAGTLVGLLSLDDIAAEARREANLLAPSVTQGSVGRTLGEIARAHVVEDPTLRPSPREPEAPLPRRAGGVPRPKA
jgi:CBS domain-containing protein